MSVTAPRTPPGRKLTVDDFLRIPEEERSHELIDGQIVKRALPVWRHQTVVTRLDRALGPYDRKAAKGRRGGWFIRPEVEIRFSRHVLLRPDLAGWRRDLFPADADLDTLLNVRPDWVCEVISPSHRRKDTVEKRTQYADFGVPHYWLVDPVKKTFVALALVSGHYIEIASFGAGEVAKTAPFTGTSFKLGELFAMGN
ncbi:MAG TPA: Uma2 family endonuclease [Pseudomonadota bacterium]|nr:Uma2 family endonuclease [Pseudomonadota bacterium]